MKNDHISRSGSSFRCSGYLFFFFIYNLIPLSSSAQWKRIGQFSQAPGAIFVMDAGRSSSFTAFVGGINAYSLPPNDTATVWRTTDGGKDWTPVFVAPDYYSGNISSFTFKDSLTGWFSSGDWTDPGDITGGCYGTTDGGNSWKSLIPRSQSQNGFRVCYNPSTKLLYYSRDGNYALYSPDEGTTWKSYGTLYPEYSSWTGYTFLDSLNGIVATAATSLQPWTKLYKYYRTTDGGYSWSPLGFDQTSYQPIVFGNAIFLIALTGYWAPLDSTVLFKSNDTGKTWLPVHLFDPIVMSLNVQADSTNLYAQTTNFIDRGTFNETKGLFVSIDTGRSWYSICGPENYDHSGFFANNYGIWAGSTDGSLWLNRTKKANADRLSFSGGSAKRIIAGTEGTFPVSISYPHEAYYEPVDSLSFVINYCGPVSYLKDSAAAGWVVFRREVNDSSVRLILRRTDPSEPQVDSLMVKVYFQSYVGATKNATLALDEINFNQDTTFRECMIVSLTKKDSLFIDFEDQCGDSILRQFVSTVSAMRITSIHPNPTSDELTVEINSQSEQTATIEIVNALGVVVYSDVRHVMVGDGGIGIDTRGLTNGMYLVRMSTSLGSASAPFVIVK